MNLHVVLNKRRMIKEKARKIQLIKKNRMALGVGVVMGAKFESMV